MPHLYEPFSTKEPYDAAKEPYNAQPSQPSPLLSMILVQNQIPTVAKSFCVLRSHGFANNAPELILRD